MRRAALRCAALGALPVMLATAAPSAGYSLSGSAPGPRLGGTELVMGTGGRIVRRFDPFLPAPDPSAGARRAIAAQAPAPGGSGPAGGAEMGTEVKVRAASFAAGLASLSEAGLIDAATYRRGVAGYDQARRSMRRLHGIRRRELGAVLLNLDRLTTAGRLSASRVEPLVLTLDRNRRWWTSGPLLADGQRVGFGGSRLVWQYYVGQGLEIQWLGTFGKANGYFLSHTHDGDLARLLDEAIGLASGRAGGLAWEYEFAFDGGRPEWVSALAQGTAVQVLSRAAIRLGRAEYFNVARRGLGVFETPPPEGVRVGTPAGAHYLMYSFAPGERILNGFIQALVGLNDFAALANDQQGRELFAAGDAEARLEVPAYDTGAWSLYDRAAESTLGYHRLLRDFLRNLCERTHAGRTPPLSSADDGVYCDTAARFTAYLHRPPVLAVAAGRPVRAGGVARLGFELSKIATVGWTVRQGGRLVSAGSAVVGRGRRRISWRAARAGRYAVRLRATDLAGNSAAVLVTVAARRS